ncbi:MAG: chloramphenicol phosphotransferase [Betaproteobacteria bacterium]|nr:MAG: chloramphenicol phosphotransferase [Betaproteobacteria bacterium]
MQNCLTHLLSDYSHGGIELLHSLVRPHRTTVSALHRQGTLVVLNGTSSSGKTSLAVELQRVAPELQLLHLQLDVFRAMEPPGCWSADYRNQAPLRLEALCRAMNKAASEFARCGQNVLVDHVLSPAACRYMLEDLDRYRVLLVKVECGIEEAERREALRKDRKSGLARSQLASVHAACSYDFEVDTTSRSASELGPLLADWLRGSPEPEAHIRMQRSRNAA